MRGRDLATPDFTNVSTAAGLVPSNFANGPVRLAAFYRLRCALRSVRALVRK